MGDFLAFFLCDFPCFWGVFAFFSKGIFRGFSRPDKQGQPQRKKTRKSKKARTGGSGFLSCWKISTYLCCFEGNKMLRFGTCAFKTQRFEISFRELLAIFLQGMRQNLRFSMCDLKPGDLRLRFFGLLSQPAPWPQWAVSSPSWAVFRS